MPRHFDPFGNFFSTRDLSSGDYECKRETVIDVHAVERNHWYVQPQRGRPTAAEEESPIEYADVQALNLEQGRRLVTCDAGLFLFLPLLASLRFDRLVQQAEYPGSQLNQRKKPEVWFVTIRGHRHEVLVGGSRILQRLDKLPASSWRKAVIDIPRRRHQNIQYVDQRVTLPDYEREV